MSIRCKFDDGHRFEISMVSVVLCDATLLYLPEGPFSLTPNVGKMSQWVLKPKDSEALLAIIVVGTCYACIRARAGYRRYVAHLRQSPEAVNARSSPTLVTSMSLESFLGKHLHRSKATVPLRTKYRLFGPARVMCSGLVILIFLMSASGLELASSTKNGSSPCLILKAEGYQQIDSDLLLQRRSLESQDGCQMV